MPMEHRECGETESSGNRKRGAEQKEMDERAHEIMTKR